MQLSAFLDVAVTLLSVYVLLSMMVTTINEFLMTLLKTRARNLRDCVHALLDDPAVRQAFLNNGLVRSMGSSSTGGKREGLPTYLDGRTFAEGLLSAISGDQQVQTPAAIRTTVEALPDSQMKQALLAVLLTAERTATDARDGIAKWFDDAMDRLRGTYVRLMKYVSLGIGFAVALTLNVDTFELANRTWNDRSSTEIAVRLAEKTVDTCQQEDLSAQLHCQTDSMRQISESIRALPVGWGPGSMPDGNDASPWWWISKVVGLLVTGLAISLGSPLVFDLLQKVMSLRGAGVKPPETEAAPPAG